jgi:hypothetical protein
MRLVPIGILLLAGCGGNSQQSNQVLANANVVANADQPAEGPIFDSIGELTMPDEVQPELRGGRAADPREWQASFYTRSAGGSCTASMVGDRVLLTAAHCVDNGAAVTLRRAGQMYRGVCEHAPEYGGGQLNKTADYALCALDRSIPGVPAERVNARAQALSVGQQIRLTGFGCTTDQGTSGNDGVYRIGEATIASLPSGSNNDIVVTGPVGLCFGDSGGPAFLIGPGAARAQVSVNSRVENRSPTGVDLGPHSYLSSLTSRAATVFLADWSRRNSLRICGVDPQATSCRP